LTWRVRRDDDVARGVCTIPALLEAASDRFGPQLLFVQGTRHATYSDFRRDVSGFSAGLRSIGVRSGDRVAILMGSTYEWMVTYFSVCSLGAVLVPLHTRYLATEIHNVLQMSQASTLIMADRFLNMDWIGMLRTICPEFASSRPGTLRSKRLPQLRSVVILGPTDHRGYQFAELAASRQSPLAVEPKVSPTDLALIKYTSGSTAAPKGVMLAHGPIIRNAYHIGERLEMDPGDRLFSAMPFYHAGGSILTILMTITEGASMVVLDHFDAAMALDAIEQHRCTVHIGMDLMYLRETQHPSFTRNGIKTLRAGHIAGSPETAMAVYRAMKFPFVNIYGMTELSGNTCMTSPHDSLERRLTWAGEPQPGIEVAICDRETGMRIAPNEVGEIWVRGWSVMRGYFGEPASTAATIRSGGWLQTGDLGLVDEVGYLKYLGRIKEILKVGMDNVSPEEVEDCLCQHPKVQLARVVGAPHTTYGEVPFAFVEVAANQECDEAELIEFCRQRLARFKVPHHIRFVHDTGWQLSGPEKISRPKLREIAREQVDGHVVPKSR
jgi:acyl-CoA synthetase (AMP-forming)/AMP-acid ligase II